VDLLNSDCDDRKKLPTSSLQSAVLSMGSYVMIATPQHTTYTDTSDEIEMYYANSTLIYMKPEP